MDCKTFTEKLPKPAVIPQPVKLEVHEGAIF